MNTREALRRRYRPNPVRILFIGESPPASGRFFYQADSGLYRAMREAFVRVDRSIAEPNFRATFQATGCYLVDLCPEPVDDLEAAARRAACRNAEPLLSRVITRLWPHSIVTVVRSIEGNVARSIESAGWTGPLTHLPYPGRWLSHRKIFVDEVALLIKNLRRQSSKKTN